MRTLLVLLFGVATACSGNGKDPDSVWSSSVSRLVLLRVGGFVGPSQPTADCREEGVEYTLVVAGRSLSARRCFPEATPPYTLVQTSVSRTLSPAELDQLVSTLEAFHVVSVDGCGEDKPAVTVKVTTPSGTTEYGDSFYSCNEERPTIDSDALEVASQAFRQLAFPER